MAVLVQRLRQFTRMPAPERRSLAAAVAINPMMLRILKRRGLAGAMKFVERGSRRRLAHRRTTISADVTALAERIGWSVNRGAADPAPEVTCLARSLTTQLLLQRRGIPAELKVGVRPGEDRRAPVSSALSFHAWVEVGGRPVNDAADVADAYAVFPLDDRSVPALDKVRASGPARSSRTRRHRSDPE